MSGRATVIGSNGLVASSQELASFYGAKILSEGGNVVDAAIATSAILCVTQNNQSGLGGDLFALVKFKGGRVENLNGSGRASENATIEFYLNEKKTSSIPKRGPLASPTVPGIVHAWGELHKRFASLDLKTLLQPAIRYAREGFPVTLNYSQSIKASTQDLGHYPEWSRIFLPNGVAPEPGFPLKQKDLGDTLEQIAIEGTSSFYEGALAEKIASGVRKQGGLISLNDLRRHSSTWTEPLLTDYRGIKVYETAPNSQAATVLLWLNMLEEYDLAGNFPLNSTKLLEILVDTCLRSLDERATAISDPEFHDLPHGFTSKEYAKKVLNGNMTAHPGAPEGKEINGDTTFFTVGNSDGDCLSVIQSDYMGFGSGVVPEGTGVVLHNRGSYFSLDSKHHNALAPGKRTFHTLCASLGELNSGRTAFTLGSMGGDVQPQIQIQLMTRIIDYGIDPQTAIDSPRWIIPCTIYERPSRIFFEPGIDTTDASLRGLLERSGLSLSTFDSLSSSAGHAQAIQFKELNGGYALLGAADPRGDGAAVGF